MTQHLQEKEARFREETLREQQRIPEELKRLLKEELVAKAQVVEAAAQDRGVPLPWTWCWN